MSCQPPHWARRNVSPASKQRPVRATVPVSLMTQNPSSPTGNETSKNLPTAKDCKDDVESQVMPSICEKPTVFLGPRGEKSKTLNFRTQPQEHYIRRTASLDAIYRASHCQPEALFLGYCGLLMIDKATQTSEDWCIPEPQAAAQLKPMINTSEQLEVKYIRQKLQRSNMSSRAGGVLLCSQRQSPVHGDHTAISSSSGSNFSSATPHNYGPALGVLHKNIHTGHISRPIPIVHGQQKNIPRLQSSVEGLNQEIERLVLTDSATSDRDFNRVLEPPPEGHRAPIAELFHSIQTCTASTESRASSGGTSSRSHSISPAIPIIPGNPEFSISPSLDDVENTHKLGSSPHSNFLSREPPDGCERVKIVEEPQRRPLAGLFPTHDLASYVLLPSQSSAFCPLYKELKRSAPNPMYNSYAMVSSTQTIPNCHK